MEMISSIIIKFLAVSIVFLFLLQVVIGRKFTSTKMRKIYILWPIMVAIIFFSVFTIQSLRLQQELNTLKVLNEDLIDIEKTDFYFDTAKQKDKTKLYIQDVRNEMLKIRSSINKSVKLLGENKDLVERIDNSIKVANQYLIRINNLNYVKENVENDIAAWVNSDSVEISKVRKRGKYIDVAFLIKSDSLLTKSKYICVQYVYNDTVTYKKEYEILSKVNTFTIPNKLDSISILRIGTVSQSDKAYCYYDKYEQK